MASSKPDQILSIADLKEAASAKLPKTIKEYYNEGAMDMITLCENETAFNRYKIRPRILTNVANVDTSTTIFGQKVTLPFGFAPAAMHGMALADGELATSRAAASTGIPMGLSTYSTVCLEDVISANSGNPYAFQLSIVKNRDTTLTWIKRAEAAGYKALILTVDAPVLGLRLNEKRNKLELPSHLTLPNMFGSTYTDSEGVERPMPTKSHVNPGKDASLSWENAIPWIQANTRLEIWLKGIYTAEDVLLAIKHGLDGVIVSNHGGRQLDGVAATIDSLVECADAAKGRIKIGIDGGIRKGSDILKALALGADFCFVGRIPIWGLAYNGQEGVEWAVRTLEQELRSVMALAGCTSIKEISRHHLAVIGASGLLCRL